jgi:hypothetical protein
MITSTRGMTATIMVGTITGRTAIVYTTTRRPIG